MSVDEIQRELTAIITDSNQEIATANQVVLRLKLLEARMIELRRRLNPKVLGIF